MVTSFDRARIIKREGRVSQDTLARIDAGLRLHLGLD